MTKKIFLISLSAILLLLCSCSPRISRSITKKYPPLGIKDEVKVIELNDNVPSQAELLGELNIEDTGFSSDCSYTSVLAFAKYEAKKAGGNVLKITKHTFPDAISSCHRITASVYKLNSADLPSIVVQKQSQPQTQPQTQAQFTDTISITKSGLGYKYKCKNEILTLNRLEELVQKNPNAAEYFNKAKGSAGFANILGYIGGFMIGWPIGTAIGGGKPVWTMALIGGGIIVLAIPIVSSAEKNLLKAVQTYNMEIKPSPQTKKYDIKLGLNQNGLALVVRF